MNSVVFLWVKHEVALFSGGLQGPAKIGAVCSVYVSRQKAKVAVCIQDEPFEVAMLDQ